MIISGSNVRESTALLLNKFVVLDTVDYEIFITRFTTDISVAEMHHHG